MTGEAWDYTNWANGEPNNAGGIENYLHIYYTSDGNRWNDISNDPGSQGVAVNGFTVEFSGSTPSTPEPGALALLSSGGLSVAGLFVRRRAKRRSR